MSNRPPQSVCRRTTARSPVNAAVYGSGKPPELYHGADVVARLARRARGADLHPVLVNDLPGVVTARRGRPVSIVAFAVVADRIVEIYSIRDSDRVRRLVSDVVRLDR